MFQTQFLSVVTDRQTDGWTNTVATPHLHALRHAVKTFSGRNYIECFTSLCCIDMMIVSLYIIRFVCGHFVQQKQWERWC